MSDGYGGGVDVAMAKVYSLQDGGNHRASVELSAKLLNDSDLMLHRKETFQLHMALGVSSGQLGDTESAQTHYTKAIEIGEGNKVTALLHRGILADITGDFSGAEEDYKSALIADSNNVKILLLRGILLAKQGFYGRAITDCSDILERDPNNIAALIVRGDCSKALSARLGTPAMTVGYELPKYLQDYTRAMDINGLLARKFIGRGFCMERPEQQINFMTTFIPKLSLPQVDYELISKKLSMLSIGGSTADVDIDMEPLKPLIVSQTCENENQLIHSDSYYLSSMPTKQLSKFNILKSNKNRRATMFNIKHQEDVTNNNIVNDDSIDKDIKNDEKIEDNNIQKSETEVDTGITDSQLDQKDEGTFTDIRSTAPERSLSLSNLARNTSDRQTYMPILVRSQRSQQRISSHSRAPARVNEKTISKTNLCARNKSREASKYRNKHESSSNDQQLKKATSTNGDSWQQHSVLPDITSIKQENIQELKKSLDVENHNDDTEIKTDVDGGRNINKSKSALNSRNTTTYGGTSSVESKKPPFPKRKSKATTNNAKETKSHGQGVQDNVNARLSAGSSSSDKSRDTKKQKQTSGVPVNNVAETEQKKIRERALLAAKEEYLTAFRRELDVMEAENAAKAATKQLSCSDDALSNEQNLPSYSCSTDLSSTYSYSPRLGSPYGQSLRSSKSSVPTSIELFATNIVDSLAEHIIAPESGESTKQAFRQSLENIRKNSGVSM